jgi:hypothetical protein
VRLIDRVHVGTQRSGDDFDRVASRQQRRGRIAGVGVVHQIVGCAVVIVGGQKDHIVDAVVVDELEQSVAFTDVSGGPGLGTVICFPELLDWRRDHHDLPVACISSET